jgi:type I restriction enzyme S subunit
VPLSSLCFDIRYGYTASAESDGTHRFVRITDIDDRGRLKPEGLKFVSPSASDLDKYTIQDGDLLIARSGSVGRAYVARDVSDAVFASYLIRFRLDRARIDPMFAFYFCYSPFFADAIASSARGAAIKNVNAEMLGALQVPLPSLREQNRIVARICEIMERVDELRSLRATAKTQANSLPTASLGDAERAISHPRVSLNDLVIESRNGRSIKSSGDSGNGAVLTLSTLRSPIADLEQRKAIVVDDATSGQFEVKQGDVFVSRSNTSALVGLSAIVEHSPPPRLIFPDLLIRLRLNERRVLPKYLVYALRFPESREQIRARAVGSSQSMVKISGERLREITVPLPELHVQAQLIASLDGLFKKTADLQARLSHESEKDVLLLGAVLRKAFSGEL